MAQVLLNTKVMMLERFKRWPFLISFFLIFITLQVFANAGGTSQNQSSCPQKCQSLGKQCGTHFGSSPNLPSCQDACNRVFNEKSGYCQTNCLTQGFLTTCNGEEENSEEGSTYFTEDDCIYSCEGHYGQCILGCRSESGSTHDGIGNCYNSCSILFTEEEGFCKFQCLTDFDFMMGCSEDESL